MNLRDEFITKPLGRKEYDGPFAWIAPSGTEKMRGCTFRARKKCDSSLLSPDGKLHIAAESYYALYFNGTLIGTGPARGTKSCNYVDTYDIKQNIMSGQNVIAVEVFCNNYPTFMAAPSQPALFLACGKVLTDESWDVQIADEYRTADVPEYTLQIGIMEWRDLRNAPNGWMDMTDSGKWQKAMLISASGDIYAKKLFLRDIPFLQESILSPVRIASISGVETLSDFSDVNVADIMTNEKHFPVTLDLSGFIDGQHIKLAPQPDNGGISLILDFDREFIGFIEIDIDAPAGTILDTGYQEMLQDDRLNLTPQIYKFADRYILGEGRQTFGSPLRWRGGRFLQVVFRNFNRPVTIHRINIIDRRYPFKNIMSCATDNDFYFKLWNKCTATLSTCAVDTIIDCPWREMSFWVNDFLVVNRYWLALTGDARLSKRCLLLALSQRNEHGLIPGVCPTNGNPRFMLFATNLFLPLILRDYYNYTHDDNCLNETLGEISGIVDKCGRFTDSSGLLLPPEHCWNFVDWSFDLNKKYLDGKNACIVNWFYVHAVDALAELYQGIDITKSEYYRHLAADFATKIEKHFWNDENGCFDEWQATENAEPSPPAGKLTHALALLSGHLSSGLENKVLAAFLRDDLDYPELYMMYYVFLALEKTGKTAEIDKLIHRFWGPIVQDDCPTIWEAAVYEKGKSAYLDTGSLCHAFSIAPVMFIGSGESTSAVKKQKRSC